MVMPRPGLVGMESAVISRRRALGAIGLAVLGAPHPQRRAGIQDGRPGAGRAPVAPVRRARCPQSRRVPERAARARLGRGSEPNATRTIPIVMVTTGDPVAGGLVASLARPGGNVTGVTALGQALSAKRLELLKETVPDASRMAVLANPTSPYTVPFLPAMYGEREFVGDGGLMFYGASLVDMYNQAAAYADKILRGARPAELPVEQPTTLELVINLGAARAIGLTIPAWVLARTDHVLP